ncbi:hypothetical protein PAHAL_3G038800 [Panicum hallii]|jgi:Leucine-rich repeat (LRR) protein|uniref:Disease resistance R13L4/SHOC-2-like LRR domain-containing protein n=1 Tax=Panicum hallii TaxID=206008 RepID=A0A2T8KH12_9POAL|nr:hypothetical protein PAHAL_3G038800 [Panicum hallii]
MIWSGSSSFSLSAEENFVTVSAHLINLVPRDKIRRLSLQFNQEVTPTMPSSGILSNLRSLTIFGSDEENQHDPCQFRFLRVLGLEDAEALKKKDHQLQSIHKLFQLKYLGLGGAVSKLPKQIQVLENLETLDISRTGIRQLLAVDGRGFGKLVHLLGTDLELPSGVGNMKELQELSMVEVNQSSTAQYVQELGKLENLRILGLKWSLKKDDNDCEGCEKRLVEALKKLGGAQPAVSVPRCW